MSTPFRSVKMHRRVLEYLGNSLLRQVDKECLRDLIVKIRDGNINLIPNPTMENMYLPIVGCNHAIVVSGDSGGDLFIIAIYPFEPPELS